MTTPGKLNKPRNPPYKLAGIGLLVIFLVALFLVYGQFRGSFTPKEKLTMESPRAGLVMDPGSKVTFNGVEIGRVDKIQEIKVGDQPAARFTLEVYPRYLSLLPENVRADLKATTVFGGKYVSLTTPKDEPPRGQFDPKKDKIQVKSVTTEINTLFQTITEIAERVDPVKL